MIPIIIAGAATIILLSGKKKKKSKKEPPQITLKADFAPGSLPVPGGQKLGPPWSRCNPPAGSPKGTEAAVSKDGRECMVFWKPDTSDVIHQHIQQELSKISKSQRDILCRADECKPDQFAPDPEAFCEWIPNPDQSEFVKDIVIKLWPQVTRSMLPPNNEDPHFVKFVWTRTFEIFTRDFCGMNPVIT